MSLLASLLPALLSGCATPHLPAAPVALESAPVTSPAPDVTLGVETHVMASLMLPSAGVLDLQDPKAVDYTAPETEVLLLLHLIEHPQHGVFAIDTGVGQAPGERVGGVGPLMGAVLKDLEVQESTAEALDGRALAGVWMTHLHSDHVLGLPDIPADVPLWVGPAEGTDRSGQNLLLRPWMKDAFGDRALQAVDPAQAQAFGPVELAWDFFGDGSLWLLSTPGHTAGSLAIWARTDQGPVLFVGDNSHTRWGWEHDVAPGSYTHDHAGNRESLGVLKELAALDPATRVVFGHQL
ncbi:MAG: MBL fold metallo-hydrolase [Myxococcota bacterium]|nr:MBL fold metallo-hydrolase [Myxococcota bacterium]